MCKNGFTISCQGTFAGLIQATFSAHRRVVSSHLTLNNMVNKCTSLKCWIIPWTKIKKWKHESSSWCGTSHLVPHLRTPVGQYELTETGKLWVLQFNMCHMVDSNMDPQRHIYSPAVVIAGHFMRRWSVRVVLLTTNFLSVDQCSRQI